MASSPMDARAVRSGEALRDALLRLLRHKAFAQITVRDICAEAGLHYATFFRHHAGKEALLDRVAAEQISTLVELTLPIQEAAGHDRAIHRLCEYVEEHRGLWSILLNGGAGGAMREEWLRRARIVTRTHEPIARWLPMELGMICSVTLIVETVSWWLRQPDGSYSGDEIAAILSRLQHTSVLSPD